MTETATAIIQIRERDMGQGNVAYCWTCQTCGGYGCGHYGPTGTAKAEQTGRKHKCKAVQR